METNTRLRHLLLGLVAVGLLALLGAGPALAARRSTQEETSNACPASSAGFREAANVAATFSNDTKANTTTYKFISLENQSPEDGVPGLIKYCVYPEPPELIKKADVTAEAKGADGSKWLATKSKRSIGFVRPGGNETNIPLDGQTTTMGKATWTELPKSQTIVLHIADEGVCGPGVPTCFVLPTGKPGPDCNGGPTNVAYSAIPFEVLERCPPRYALAFEATSTKEAGDAVKLAGTGKEVHSLTAAFASFACSKSGVWYETNCVTDPGKTYKHEIFARIYTVEGEPGEEKVGKLLSTVEVDATIPYRPSAEGEEGHKCGAKYWDAAAERCKSAINFLVTFGFEREKAPVPADRRVIWTVSVDTTNNGYHPIGKACVPPAFENGCPYDALNLDTWSYAGEFGTLFPGESLPSASPYSGTDLNAKQWWTAGPLINEGVTPKPEADGQSGEGVGGEPHPGELRPVGEIITE